MYNNSSNNSIGGLLFGFIGGPIFLVIGIALIVLVGLPSLRQAKDSADWPHVTGAIDSSKVVSRVDKDGTSYAPQVTYRYTVEGVEHTSSSIRIGGGQTWSGSSTAAKHFIAQYPMGKSVSVYYDPTTPAEAALEPGVGGASYLPLLIGVGFTIVGLLLFGGTIIMFFLAGTVIVGALAFFGKSSKNASQTPMKRRGRNLPTEMPEISEDAFDL